MTIKVIDELERKDGPTKPVARASRVSVDPANFTGNLGPTDTDVQAALETLDAILGGGSAWGLIAGTLADQEDLQLALDAKSNTDHTHPYLSDSTTTISTQQAIDIAANKTHAVSAHASSDAQKNSDITKAEIEAKLTGEITSHGHPAPRVSKPFADTTNRDAFFVLNPSLFVEEAMIKMRLTDATFKWQKLVSGIWTDQDTGSGGGAVGADHALLDAPSLEVGTSGHMFMVDTIVGEARSLQSKLKGNAIEVFDFVPEAERTRITNKLIDITSLDEIDHSVYIQAAIDYKKAHPEITEIIINSGWWMIRRFLSIENVQNLCLSGSNKGAVLFVHPGNLYSEDYLRHYYVQDRSNAVMLVANNCKDVVIYKVHFHGNYLNCLHSSGNAMFLFATYSDKFIITQCHFEYIKQYSSISTGCCHSGWLHNTYENLFYGADYNFVFNFTDNLSTTKDYHVSARQFFGWGEHTRYEIKFTYAGSDGVTDPDRFVWRKITSVRTDILSITEQNGNILVHAPGHTLSVDRPCIVGGSYEYDSLDSVYPLSIAGDYLELPIPYTTDVAYIAFYILPRLSYFDTPGNWSNIEHTCYTDSPANIIKDAADINRPDIPLPNQYPLLRDDGTVESGANEGTYGAGIGVDVYFDSAIGHAVGDTFSFSWQTTLIVQFTLSSNFDRRWPVEDKRQYQNFQIGSRTLGLRHELTGGTAYNQYDYVHYDNNYWGCSLQDSKKIYYAKNCLVVPEMSGCRDVLIENNFGVEIQPSDGSGVGMICHPGSDIDSARFIGLQNIVIRHNVFMSQVKNPRGLISWRKCFFILQDSAGGTPFVGLQDILITGNTFISLTPDAIEYAINVWAPEDALNSNIVIDSTNVCKGVKALVNPYGQKFTIPVIKKSIDLAQVSASAADEATIVLESSASSSTILTGYQRTLEKIDAFDYGTLRNYYFVASMKGGGNVDILETVAYFNFIDSADFTCDSATCGTYRSAYFGANGGHVNEAVGLHIFSVYGPGTVDTQYGLVIDNMTGATTNYAIYSGGGQSYHAGAFTFDGELVANAGIVVTDTLINGSLFIDGIVDEVHQTIQAVPGQTSDYQQWLDGGGVKKAYIDNAGYLHSPLLYGDASNCTGIETDFKFNQVNYSNNATTSGTGNHYYGVDMMPTIYLQAGGTNGQVHSFEPGTRIIPSTGTNIVDLQDNVVSSPGDVTFPGSVILYCFSYNAWRVLSQGNHGMQDHTDYTAPAPSAICSATNTSQNWHNGNSVAWTVDTIGSYAFWNSSFIADAESFDFDPATGMLTLNKTVRIEILCKCVIENSASGAAPHLSGLTISPSASPSDEVKVPGWVKFPAYASATEMRSTEASVIGTYVAGTTFTIGAYASEGSVWDNYQKIMLTAKLV